MAGKRPIDLFRESAGSAKAPDQCGNNIAVLGCEKQKRLYMLGETGISSMVFADQIDPDRLNPAIPRIVQRVELEYGATTEFVQQTVGMAMTLFKDATHLPKGFDREAAFLEALSVALDLGEISDTIRELSRSEAETRENIERRKLDISRLPKTQNLRGRANQCVGHLANVRTSTIRIAQMFYPKTNPKEGWSQALKREFENVFSDQQEQLSGIMGVLDYLRTVVDWRNSLEHPSIGQAVKFQDYELSALGEVIAPTIEVEHRTSKLERQDLVRFLDRSVVSLGNAFETLIPVCCDQNIPQFSEALTTRVARFPDEKPVRGSHYFWLSEWNNGFPKIAGAGGDQVQAMDHEDG